jgi:DNA/RNA-binding domain of Phe-tRNA-synthetase-like protein
VGDVILRTGEPGDQYEGIRKGPVNLGGRLGLFDREGPFGSPTSDSARTCTSAETTLLLAVIMATASYSRDGMEKNLSTFSSRFQDFCGADETFRAVLGVESS